MVEKIIINPNKVRGYGNIVSSKGASDFITYAGSITEGTDTVYGATEKVFSLEDTFLFTDGGVTGNYNSNWTNDSNWMTVTRSDEYTTLSNTVNSYAVYRANNNTAFAGDITIEWDNHGAAASSLFLGIRGTSAVNKSFTSLGIGGNCKVRVTVIDTTATVYVDNVEISSYSINRDSNSKVTVLLQVSRGNGTVQYSNFVIYNI